MATTITKTNKPAIAGTKYKSAADCDGTSVGAAVGAAGSTAKLVSALDGQYDSEPAKVAIDGIFACDVRFPL